MNDELVFYTNPMSRGRIVRWMLEEVGSPYRTVVIELGKKIEDVEFLALNPMGKVPVVTHGSQVVTECAAICAYLADAFPDAGLAPPQGVRGPYYRWLFFGAGCIEAATIDAMLGVQVPPEREGTVGYRNLSAVIDTLEWAVQQNDYIAGPSFTAADVYIGAQLSWGMQMQTIEERPALRRYVDRVHDREALRRAENIDNELARQS